MSRNALMTTLMDSLPPEAREALGLIGDIATLQQEHAQLQQENLALRTNRDQLNENLSRVMKRDGELVQEVRDLRGVLSRWLLCVDVCKYCDKSHETHASNCVQAQALALATRSTEWCMACNENHPVLLSDADQYVICPKTFPHHKARGR